MGVDPQEEQLPCVEHHFVLDVLWEVVYHENIRRVWGIFCIFNLAILLIGVFAFTQIVLLQLFPALLIQDSPVQTNEYHHLFIEGLPYVLGNVYKEQWQNPITVRANIGIARNQVVNSVAVAVPIGFL